MKEEPSAFDAGECQMMTGMGTMIKREQELGLIRTGLPTELLMAWFRAIDSASDDWLFADLDQLDQETITHISRQTIAAMRQALSPLTSITL